MTQLRKSADVLNNHVLTSPDWVFLFSTFSVWGMICPLYSTYIMLWINSFVDSGVLANDYEVKAAFTLINWWALPIAFCAIFVCLFVIDKV